MSTVRILTAVIGMVIGGTASAESEAGRLVLQALWRPAAVTAEGGVTDRQLFEMCCWARGRSGFNHCTQYGVCLDHPEAVCRGRGAAAGMQLGCESEPKGEDSDGRQTLPEGHGE